MSRTRGRTAWRACSLPARTRTKTRPHIFSLARVRGGDTGVAQAPRAVAPPLSGCGLSCSVKDPAWPGGSGSKLSILTGVHSFRGRTDGKPAITHRWKGVIKSYAGQTCASHSTARTCSEWFLSKQHSRHEAAPTPRGCEQHHKNTLRL